MVLSFYIQVNLLDAFERGSGLGAIDNYKNKGIITTGPSYSPNVGNIIHEYLHGIINPITDSLTVSISDLNISTKGTTAAKQGYTDKNEVVNECIIRALTAIGLTDDIEHQKDGVIFEMDRGFIMTQYFYDKFQEYDKWQGNLTDFIREMIEQY